HRCAYCSSIIVNLQKPICLKLGRLATDAQDHLVQPATMFLPAVGFEIDVFGFRRFDRSLTSKRALRSYNDKTPTGPAPEINFDNISWVHQMEQLQRTSEQPAMNGTSVLAICPWAAYPLQTACRPFQSFSAREPQEA